MLALFDLDGFKAYNDSFGHPAGDALLRRLGHGSRDSVAAAGAAYRIGGDEFCVLFDGTARRAGARPSPPARRRWASAGAGFAVTSSLRRRRARRARPTRADAALQLADQRMYAQKDSRRVVRRAPEPRTSCCGCSASASPSSASTSTASPQLAVAVGRRLGLEPERARRRSARAAELHDIGKIAIPDAILDKPGPLDDEEWAFMRQHTVLGERILASAPALRPVARIVRSSHERFDGGGYPDGLAGETIPLGVADHLRLRRLPRDDLAAPLLGRRRPREALAELRRCAGTQFDPASSRRSAP